MDTVAIHSAQTKIIAHRGLSGLEAENTCAAFVAAGNRSYFGIETDVHVTKDGLFAVIHDNDTSRVSAVDKNVEKSTLEELQSIPLYNMTPRTYRTDLRIPALDDYIGICKRYGKEAVLKLKNPIKPTFITKIIDSIRRQEYLEHVIFISFVWDNVVAVRELLPQQKVQFLTSKADNRLINKLIRNRIDLDIAFSSVTGALVRRRLHYLQYSGITPTLG